MKQPIKVWRYEDAPDELKYKSHHGGDEDWIALVPKDQVTDGVDTWIPWAESGTTFGCCDVQKELLEDGSLLLIGAHS